MATHDNAVVVSVSAQRGAIAAKDFGTVLHATDDLGAGFTERLRVYESAREVKADADVNPTTQDYLADFAFAQEPRVQRVAIGRVDYLATLSDELDALVAAESSLGISFYGLDLSSLTEADILDAAAWAESSEKLLIAQTADAAVPAGTAGNVAEDLAGFLYDRSGIIYHATVAERLALGWMAKKLAKDPDTGKTSWRHCSVTGVAVDDLTSTEKTTIQANSANTYLNLRGLPTTAEGVLASGNPIDTRISRDWLKFRLEEAISARFVAFSNRNQDIPYDQDGLDMMFGIIMDFMDRGVTLRHFAVDSQQFQRPLIAAVPLADRVARLMRLDGSVRLAGAIEKAAVQIAVEF